MTMTPSTSVAKPAPTFMPSRVGSMHIAETARAIHVAFARSQHVQYAICGAYALALVGCPRPIGSVRANLPSLLRASLTPRPQSLECIVGSGKFGAVKRVLGGAQWWHPRVAAGAMTSYYTTVPGVTVEVRWAEAGVLGPRHIVPGPGGTVALASGGVFALNATQLLRAAVKAYAAGRDAADADTVRWLAASAGLDVDARRAVAGLDVEVAAVSNELPFLRWALH